MCKNSDHRFAQFFTGPLMARDAMEREREAVDSEFQMALPSDDNRLCQVRRWRRRWPSPGRR